MYFDRAFEDRWLDASGHFPALLLTGPRQVGKTTSLQRLCEPGRRYVTLDDYAARELANRDPVLFLERFGPPVLIDEIQYAPGLLSVIKLAVDSRRTPGAFWLTGSQQFHLMKGVSESLAGRVAVVNLLGLSTRERQGQRLDMAPFLPLPEVLSEREGIPRRGASEVFGDIWRGSLPELVAQGGADHELYLASYVQTYLERDLRDLAQVGDLESFSRFLKACAARTGQLLNLSSLANDIDISVPTAKRWLSILVSTFQVYLLQPYHTNLSKRLIKTPKLYFLDTGLCCHLTRWSSPQTLEAGAMAGPLFETYVVSEVLKSWWHRLRQPSICFYRDRDQKEIDLLFEQDQRLLPVEIKRAATVRRDWARSFTILDRFPTASDRGAVICLVPEAIPLARGITAVPVDWV